MMKFYDLKANAVPQVLFVLLLAISFGFRVLVQPLRMDCFIYSQQIYNTLPDVQATENLSTQLHTMIEFQNSEVFLSFITILLKIVGILTLQKILMALLLFFYLGGYLVDLEGPSSSFAVYANKFFKALPRYLLFNIIFYVALLIIVLIVVFIMSFAMLVFPMFAFASSFIVALAWFIIQVVFIFKDITFLDTGVSVWRNFKTSIQLSKGYGFFIGRNIIFIYFLSLLINMFTIESQLVSMFIISFFEVIILQIRQRLVALMYISRTRKPKEDIELNKA